MNRFPQPYFEGRPNDAELDRNADERENIARERHVDCQMRYGPCSHLWSEPDDHGVVECLWCFGRQYGIT